MVRPSPGWKKYLLHSLLVYAFVATEIVALKTLGIETDAAWVLAGTTFLVLLLLTVAATASRPRSFAEGIRLGAA